MTPYTMKQCTRLVIAGVCSLALTACTIEEDSEDSAFELESGNAQTQAPEATPASNDSQSDSADGQTESTDDQVSSEEPVSEEATAPQFFYFSYDDSASTASFDLAMYSLDNDLPISSSWGRSYEFLNAETFSHFNEQTSGPFSASIGLYEHYDTDLNYTYHFGVNLTGPTATKDDRQNVILTLLIDVSGSMQSNYSSTPTDENGVMSLLDVTKAGLVELEGSLKSGDLVNIVTFSSNAETVLEGWTYDQDINTLISAINNLDTLGSTNLDQGIELAYQLASTHYDETKANRVVILTDAFANTGQTNVEIISNNTEINELEGIHFSGIGIGDGFREEFLNELTEAGKGSYFAMITPQDAQRIFTDGFPSLINVAVEDVKFKLTYPASLSHVGSAAEEVSENEYEVQSTNFSYNTSQFFIESFQSTETLELADTFTLDIIYLDDETNKLVTESLSYTVEDLVSQGTPQIIEALLVSGLANVISGALSCEDVVAYLTLATDFQTDKTLEYSTKIESYCSAS